MNVKNFAAMMTGITCLCGFNAGATTSAIFNNQSEWQAASSDYGVNPLTTINLTTATYVNVVVPYPEGDDALTLSLNAPFEVAFDDSNNLSGFFPYPVVANGSVTSPIERRNSLIITFGQPIYAFGGIFSAPGIYVASPGGNMVTGFDGFTSDTPFTVVQLFDNYGIVDPNNPNAGAIVSISDIQVSTVPTPEPMTTSLVGLAALLLVPFRRLWRL